MAELASNEVALDTVDRRLLDAVQVEVPLTARPFAALGRQVGIGEADSKWKIVADKVSNSARQKIEAAGGTIELIVKEKWTRPDRKKKADAPKAASSEA